MQLRFLDRAALVVQGSLQAAGTADTPIIFTSATSTVPGAWCGIGVYEGASADLRHVSVRYAGIPGGFQVPNQLPKAAAVFDYRGDLSLTDSEISFSGGDGVFCLNDSATPRSLTLTSNAIASSMANGVNIDGINTADSTVITGNSVASSGAFPFRVSPSALGRVDSANQMSGNASGNGVAVTAGSITASVTLAAGRTFFMLGKLTVPAGLALTITQGDLLRFRGGVKLQVDGALYSLGDKYAPAGLVADAASPTPSTRWAGIGVSPGAGVSLVNTVVGGAGYASAFQVPGVPGYTTASVFAYRGDVYLNSVSIVTGGGDGVYWYDDAGPHTLTMVDGTINNVGGNGCVIARETPGDVVAITGNTMANVQQYPLVIPARRLSDLSGNDIAANAVPAVAISGGALNRPAAMDPGGLYHVLQPLTVPQSTSLTIGAGASVLFAQGAYLDVFGTLSSQGTSAAPVALTSIFPAPVPGDWGGVGIEPGAAATMNYTAVRSAGEYAAFLVADVGVVQAGVVVNRASLSATGLTCDSNLGYGVFMYNPASPIRTVSITGSIFSNNQLDGLHVHRTAAGDAFSFSGVNASGNAGDGLRIMNPAAQIAVTSLHADSNGSYPLRLPANLLGSVTSPAFSANAAGDYVALTAESVVGDVTVSFPIGLLGVVEVPAGAALRMLPGAELTGQAQAYLRVEGNLTAAGTSPADPIRFHGPPDAADGAWGGLALFEGASATLTNVAVLDAGEPGDYTVPLYGGAAAGILAYRADLSVNGLHVSKSGGDGITVISDGPSPRVVSLQSVSVDQGLGTGINIVATRIDDAISLAQITVMYCGSVAVSMPMRALYSLGGGNAFGGNAGGDGVAVTAGTTEVGTLRRNATVPEGTTLFVGSQVSVASGARLVLGAGVTASMGALASLVVCGELDANGAPERPVLFTANSPAPAPGGWAGIGFAPGSVGTLTGLEARYGGASFTVPGPVTAAASLIVSGAAVTLDGCLFRDGAGTYAVVRGSTTIAATNTTFVDNASGPHVRLIDSGASGSVAFGGTAAAGCDYLSLGDGAVTNGGPATVAARYCYWDAPDGPRPVGSGAGVSGAVDFTPYAAAPVNAPVALLSTADHLGHGLQSIAGTAASPYFASAVLEYGEGANPSAFSVLASPPAPVAVGTLGTWDTSSVSDGDYTLRLTVTDRLGRVAVTTSAVNVASGPAASGDVSGNGTVDLADAILALRIAGGLAPATSGAKAAGDVMPDPGTGGHVGDGYVTLEDVTAILRKALHP